MAEAKIFTPDFSAKGGLLAGSQYADKNVYGGQGTSGKDIADSMGKAGKTFAGNINVTSDSEITTEGAIKVGTGVTINTTTGLIVNSGGVKVTGIATFADELDAAQYEGNFILDSYLFT